MNLSCSFVFCYDVELTKLEDKCSLTLDQMQDSAAYAVG